MFFIIKKGGKMAFYDYVGIAILAFIMNYIIFYRRRWKLIFFSSLHVFTAFYFTILSVTFTVILGWIFIFHWNNNFSFLYRLFTITLLPGLISTMLYFPLILIFNKFIKIKKIPLPNNDENNEY